jgi:hypothetical protein
MEAWSFRDVIQLGDAGGASWQSEHSCGAARVVVGAPLFQSTASCFISPVAGERLASTGPTNPAGAERAWQSMHLAGCVASDACSRPGKNVPEAAPAWQALHARDAGTVPLLWNIGIGSVSRCAVTLAIDVPEYEGMAAVTTTSCAASRTLSGVPMPPDQSPPGSEPEALKYRAYDVADRWQEKQSAVPLTA